MKSPFSHLTPPTSNQRQQMTEEHEKQHETVWTELSFYEPDAVTLLDGPFQLSKKESGCLGDREIVKNTAEKAAMLQLVFPFYHSRSETLPNSAQPKSIQTFCFKFVVSKLNPRYPNNHDKHQGGFFFLKKLLCSPEENLQLFWQTGY